MIYSTSNQSSFDLPYTQTSHSPSLPLRQPSQRRNNIPIHSHLQRRHHNRREQPAMIHRQILMQPPLLLRPIPLPLIRATVHEERVRFPNRTRQHAEILTPCQLRHVSHVPVPVEREVRAEGPFQLLGEFRVVDCEREGAGCLVGWGRYGVAGESFGVDDSFDAREGAFAG